VASFAAGPRPLFPLNRSGSDAAGGRIATSPVPRSLTIETSASLAALTGTAATRDLGRQAVSWF
jgi:hypothetical protein